MQEIDNEVNDAKDRAPTSSPFFPLFQNLEENRTQRIPIILKMMEIIINARLIAKAILHKMLRVNQASRNKYPMCQKIRANLERK